MKTPEGHINLTHKISPQDPHPPNKTALTHSASPNIARETWAVTRPSAVLNSTHTVSFNPQSNSIRLVAL